MKKKFKSYSELKEAARDDKDIQNEIRNNPEAIGGLEVEPPVYVKDLFIYRTVVIVMGAVIVFSVIAIIIIMIMGGADIDKRIPAVLTAMSSAALGALAGLLVPAPQQQQQN